MKNKGFSLVELIVVIAIMAILVGVAVPVYTSYIDKAHKEADRQLVSEIKHAIEIANAADPFEGTVTIILTNDGYNVVGADSGALAAEAQRIEGILNTQISGDLKLKYSGWGNGVAATINMMQVLNSNAALRALCEQGNPDNLSFTEQIPDLLDEIRNVAVDVTGRLNMSDDDAAVIGLVQSAATNTSGLDQADVDVLWHQSIAYNGEKYILPGGISEDEIDLLSTAALIRAKNTCVALYLQNNWPAGSTCPANLYSVVSACAEATVTGSGSDIFPYDVTAVKDNNTQMGNLLAALGISPADPVVGQLTTLLTGYFGSPVSTNDALAYYGMMKTINKMDQEETLNEENLDEYFEGASVPVKVFQDMISGKLDYAALVNVNGNYGDNNITITVSGDGKSLTFVIGPAEVLE